MGYKKGSKENVGEQERILRIKVEVTGKWSNEVEKNSMSHIDHQLIIRL